MSQSAMPATQNDMTTCLETLEKEKFCSFPHRHCEATGKPETRDETRGRKKTSISCETSSKLDMFDTLSNRLECHKVPRRPRKTTWQPAWTHSNRRGFPASPIDTATPQENQRLDTRHVNAEKPAFRTRLPPIFTVGNMTKGQVLQLPHRHGEATGKPETRDETGGSTKTSISCETSSNFQLCSSKIDVFLRVFLRTWKFVTSKSIFRARLPSIFNTCEKMPRLPRNLHLVTTWRSPANAIYKNHATGRV